MEWCRSPLHRKSEIWMRPVSALLRSRPGLAASISSRRSVLIQKRLRTAYHIKSTAVRSSIGELLKAFVCAFWVKTYRGSRLGMPCAQDQKVWNHFWANDCTHERCEQLILTRTPFVLMSLDCSNSLGKKRRNSLSCSERIGGQRTCHVCLIMGCLLMIVQCNIYLQTWCAKGCKS